MTEKFDPAQRDGESDRIRARAADVLARATAGRPCAADSPLGLKLFFLDELEACVPEELRDVLAEARRCVVEGQPRDPVVARLWLGLERVSTSGSYYRSRLAGRALAIREALRAPHVGGVKYRAPEFVEVMELGPKTPDPEVLATPVLDRTWSELQLGWGSRPQGREEIVVEILTSLDHVAGLSASFARERDVLASLARVRAGGVPPQIEPVPFPENLRLDLKDAGYGYRVTGSDRQWFSVSAHLGVDLPSPVPANWLRPTFAGRDVLPDLYEPETMHAVMEALVRQWEPDWAEWGPHFWTKCQVDPAGMPPVGWVTYLADGGRPVDGATVRTLPGLPGAVYTLEKDYASITLGDVLGLRERLRAAGVLRSPIEGVRW